MQWRKEYDNDTGNNDESFYEWWKVTNSEMSFDCKSEKDANWLADLLNKLPSLTLQQGLDLWDMSEHHALNSDRYNELKFEYKKAAFLSIGIDIDKLK